MLKLHHEDTLKYYVNKYKILDIFKIDFTKNMELHCFCKDEFIVCECTSPNYLYFLVEGKINKINFPINSNVIGALEIFTDSNFNYNLKAIDDCICIGIPRCIVENIAFENINFLKYFCRLFSSEIHENNSSENFFKKEKDAI
ncbi:MAG: hypothetical protein RR765_08265 [Peptostreptococcaceae bacterium]